MPNSRLRQLIAVLETYTGWWFTWLVLAIYVAGIALVFASYREPDSLSSSVSYDFSGQPLERLPADLSTVDSVVVNPGQLDNALRPDSPLRIAGALPNLKRLVVFEPLKEPHLIELLQHQRLKSLVLNRLENMTVRGWAALESQPLENLQILSLDRELWQTGRWPLTVKTLLIQDDQTAVREPDQSHLEPLLRLPLLQTVKVRLVPDKDGHLRTADRDALLRMSAIRRLYLDEISPSFIRDVQKELPRIAVRPSTYRPGRVHRALQLIGLGFIPLMLLLHVVSLQFVTPASHIVPNFHRSHWRIAVFLVLCCGFVQATALVAAGCDFLSAVGLSCIVLPPIWVIVMLVERSSRFPGFTHFPFVIAVFAAFPVLLLPVAANEAESDWILAGHHPAIAGMLIALELAALIGLSRFFARLCRRLVESDEGPVPFGMWDMKGFQDWNLRNSKGLKFQERIWGRGQERRLSAALRSPKTSVNHQTLLWRASHQMTAVWFAIWMAGAMSIGVAVVVPFIPQGILKPDMLWPFWIQVTIFMWFLPFMRLMQQRPYFSRHLLSSCGRREWVRLIFRETARDFVPAVIASVLGLVGYSMWGSAQGWSTGHVAALAAALLCVVYGISLLMVTFSTQVQAAIAIGGFVGLLAFVFIPLLMASQSAPSAVEKVLFWPTTWWMTLFVVAAMLIHTADHRWMTWELDSIRT